MEGKRREEGMLREWFDRVDLEKSGSITASQLKTALGVGHLDIPISVVQQMIRLYDFDRSGTMSFPEFVSLNNFLLKVQHAFSDLERGRGYLTPEDVYEALVKIGFSLDSPAFYTVCESFDQRKNGKFQLDDFISICVFVQSARNLFNSFDTARQGRITLDLNQFIYCSKSYTFFTATYDILESLKLFPFIILLIFYLLKHRTSIVLSFVYITMFSLTSVTFYFAEQTLNIRSNPAANCRI